MVEDGASRFLSVLFKAVDLMTLMLEKVVGAGGSTNQGPCFGLIHKPKAQNLMFFL